MKSCARAPCFPENSQKSSFERELLWEVGSRQDFVCPFSPKRSPTLLLVQCMFSKSVVRCCLDLTENSATDCMREASKQPNATSPSFKVWFFLIALYVCTCKQMYTWDMVNNFMITKSSPLFYTELAYPGSCALTCHRPGSQSSQESLGLVVALSRDLEAWHGFTLANGLNWILLHSLGRSELMVVWGCKEHIKVKWRQSFMWNLAKSSGCVLQYPDWPCV